MKQRSGRIGMVAAAAVVLLLSSCGGDSRPQSTDSWGASFPSSTKSWPSFSASPKPQPSETFSPEQLEAANTLIEYYRITDEIFTNPDADTQPLKDIAIGESQTIQMKHVTERRAKGQVQTGTTVVHITGASEPEETDGVRSIDVQMCTDSEKVDMIDSATGKSVVPPGRPSYLQWNVTVVKTNGGWKFGDATNETVLRCPA